MKVRAAGGAREVTVSAGMTLIELLLAISLMAVAVIAILQVVVSVSVNNMLNRQRVEAVADAQEVFDALRLVRDKGGVVPDDIMAAYPPGEIALANLTLPEETVEVAYQLENNLPLMVTITVSWNGMNGRFLQLSFSSALERL